MRALITDAKTRDAAARIVAYAAAPQNRLTVPLIEETIAGARRPIGDDPRHVLHIPMGFRCVFSIDQGKSGEGWYRHLSVSVDGDKMPHPMAVEEIMTFFGFTGGMEECLIYMEKEPRAVNVMQEFQEFVEHKEAEGMP